MFNDGTIIERRPKTVQRSSLFARYPLCDEVEQLAWGGLPNDDVSLEVDTIHFEDGCIIEQPSALLPGATVGQSLPFYRMRGITSINPEILKLCNS
jgi:hypothetical protein